MSSPALRFKNVDGQDFPEWKAGIIGSALAIGSGKDYKHLSSGDIPVYGTGGYMLSVNDYLYDGESVCIGRKGTIDRPTLLKGKFWTVDTLFYTHSFKNCLPKFIYATFQRIDWKNYNEASGVPSLSKSTIEKIEIKLPSLPEQTKIANFLTAVDEKITQLTQKHGLLTKYKKGVMQQIFCQKLCFKDDDGKNFPEWEDKNLGDICDIRTGKKDVNEGNPNGVYPFFTCAKKHTYSDNYSFDCSAILIAGNGEVGHCQKFHGKFEAYQRTYVLSHFKEEIEYIFCHLNSTFQDVVSSQKQMGAMPYLKLAMLTDFSIPVPVKKEQIKIANFLTALDDKITATQTQLQAVKQYKQGLLQQIFV